MRESNNLNRGIFGNNRSTQSRILILNIKKNIKNGPLTFESSRVLAEGALISASVVS